MAIVGTGELEDELKTLSQELNLEDTVHFLGFQPNPIKMVACSKAMILTSRWEGTPMCALEAMALGTPVVSTPSDGMKDLLTDGVSGYLTESDEQMAEDLLKIFTQPEHRKLLAENARKKFDSLNDGEAYKRAIWTAYQ